MLNITELPDFKGSHKNHQIQLLIRIQQDTLPSFHSSDGFGDLLEYLKQGGELLLLSWGFSTLSCADLSVEFLNLGRGVCANPKCKAIFPSLWIYCDLRRYHTDTIKKMLKNSSQIYDQTN